jgi:hypothetical protein
MVPPSSSSHRTLESLVVRDYFMLLVAEVVMWLIILICLVTELPRIYLRFAP